VRVALRPDGLDNAILFIMLDPATIGSLVGGLKGAGAGSAAGFASGMLGVSSGGILVPAVCAAFGVDQHVAQGVSLIVQIPPTSLAGFAQYRRRKRTVPVAWLAQLSAGFLAGGALGAFMATGLSDRTLRWLFVGYLLVLAAVSLLRGRAGPSADDAPPDPARWSALLAIGVAGGFSSGLLGIGGGLAVTALSTTLLHLGQHRAQALSLMLVALPLTAPAAGVYVARGWPLPWYSIIGIVFGLALGAAGGAAVANRLPERALRPALTVFAVGLAAYMATR